MEAGLRDPVAYMKAKAMFSKKATAYVKQEREREREGS
jgi:hypothetical protein